MRGICTNTWVVDVGRGLLAAKPELRYWAMPASGKGRGQRGGRNTERDFHGEKRRNDTHSSSTDADARLFRKVASKE